MPARNVHNCRDRFPARRRIRLPLAEYRAGHVFFVTVGTHQRSPWFGRYPELARVVEETLGGLAAARGTVLFAWCVMPDHVHLLLDDADLVEVVRLFKGRMSAAARKVNPGVRLWQRSFFDHALRDSESVYRVARYIWENPVRAGLAEVVADYRWSGSRVWEGFRDHTGHD